MKTITLTHGYSTIVDDDDFEKLSKFKWYATPFPKGGDRRAIRYANNRMVHLSREIMNCPKGLVVDHINGDTLDNRKCNLRSVSNTENIQNRKKQRNNSSGYTGVFKYQNKTKTSWYAFIRVNKKGVYLGMSDTKEGAAEAYNKAVIKLGGKQRLNIIKKSPK